MTFPFENAGGMASFILAADWLIRLLLAGRIILRGKPVGITFAWLTLVLIFPIGGAILYLMFGELRLGNRRAEWARRIHGPFQAWLSELRERTTVDWLPLGDECRSLANLCQSVVGMPAMPDNELKLLRNADATLRSIVTDIDAAERSCHLEFYIWHPGGAADLVVEALVRAAARGVACRVLVDAVGSHEFLGSVLVRSLRAGGVAVRAALPVGLTRMLFYRLDLRIHRKIVVIDGQIGYTGSMNLVDPSFFKQDAGVGQWIDAMVRMRGPAVEALAVTFLEDWELEAAEGLERVRAHGGAHAVASAGSAVVQVVPSGPTTARMPIQAIVLSAIYSAHTEVVLTTPYFVPDEIMVIALASAAARGVQVTIVIPRRVDSRLVRLASEAHKGDLLAAGVRIVLFEGGLLHTKSITVDGRMCLFGSLNLDPRSLQLNFEITLAIYDAGFTGALRDLQADYISQATQLDLKRWETRSITTRFVDNAARLLSPLL
ncbi:MAG TPA: cardiolipin synthase [Pirellulales bacterium]|jgi:cardiolipin synthase